MGKIFSREDDRVVLELLDLRWRVGLRGGALREAMARITGDAWSNGRLQGALSRYRVEPGACSCLKPENRDGGMPVRWWAT